MVERLRRNRRSQGQRANRNGRRPRVEQLERRDLLATFSYSEVYAEATLTDFASGVSEVVRLRGTATGAYSDSVGSLALEDKSQQLLTLSLDGFDAKQFGAIHVSLNQASLSTGRIVERRNDVVGQLELPATSQFDVDFQAQITTYNGTVPQVVTVRPDSPVRIEAGIGELPVGINDTFRLRGGSVNLSATPGSPIISLSDLALTFRPLFAKIEGQKFQDTNANGVRDPGETGINGWLIAAVDLNGAQQSIAAAQLTHDIDLNGDQVIDPETESGLYVFDGLATPSRRSCCSRVGRRRRPVRRSARSRRLRARATGGCRTSPLSAAPGTPPRWSASIGPTTAISTGKPTNKCFSAAMTDRRDWAGKLPALRCLAVRSIKPAQKSRTSISRATRRTAGWC